MRSGFRFKKFQILDMKDLLCIVFSPYIVQNKKYEPLILYDFRVLKLQNKGPPL